MSKKILKRSLALGALMAFVITGSAWASIIQNESSIGVTSNNTIPNNSGSTLTISGEIFKNLTATGNQFITNEGTANIIDTKFENIGVTGNSSKAVIITQSGGELNLTNVVIQPNYSASNGLNVAANSKANIYGTDNIFKGYMGRGVFNYGTLTFKNDSVTTFDAWSTSFDITNRNGGRVVVQEGATVNLNGKGIDFEVQKSAEGLTSIDDIGYVDIEGTISGNISGHNCINFNGGTLKGKMSEGKNNSRKSTGFCEVEFNGGIWYMTGDSVVKGIVVNGDAIIDGNSDMKYKLGIDKEINPYDKYLIEHKDGMLVINSLTIDGIEKVTTSGNSNGSILNGSSNADLLVIANSVISNNKNVCSEGLNWSSTLKPYAIIDVSSNMNIENTIFTNNETDYMGGALYLHTKEFNITDSVFENNSADQGAAIQTNAATVNFIGENTFKGNKSNKASNDSGGAITTQGGTMNFIGETHFEENIALNGNGGAINSYYDNSTMNFAKKSNTYFNANYAKLFGGAIHNNSTSVLNFNGIAEFTNNEAGNGGGAIYNDSIVNFNDGSTTVFRGNTTNSIANDIYNAGTVNINQGAKVKLGGGIDGRGTTNINGGILELGGNNRIGTLKVTDSGKIVFGENGHLDVDKIDASSDDVTITMVGKNADDLNTKAQLTTVAERMGVAEDYKTTDKVKVVMAKGDIVGETTGDVVFETTGVEGDDTSYYHGVVKNKIEAPNPANEAISDTGISMKLHWRAHVNDMNKRMGELRDANGEHGVWTRMVRGESEYKNTKAQYNQYQLGYDEKLSVDKRWTVGAAVTFSEGDASYGYGSTEDKSTAFAIYGSKLNNDGTFVDLIARYAHLESDVDDQAGEGSYSANGMSVSAEFGKRIQQGNGLWVEHQVELTYGTIDSAEYKLGTKTVEVGDMDSLIGRVGFRIGKDIEKGNVYARAAYLYDFEGETENAFSNDTARRSFNEDLGGGWWEVGVGANINLSKATYLYADVEKTFGGEVDTNWQWNLGVRYSF